MHISWFIHFSSCTGKRTKKDQTFDIVPCNLASAGVCLNGRMDLSLFPAPEYSAFVMGARQRRINAPISDGHCQWARWPDSGSELPRIAQRTGLCQCAWTQLPIPVAQPVAIGSYFLIVHQPRPESVYRHRQSPLAGQPYIMSRDAYPPESIERQFRLRWMGFHAAEHVVLFRR